MAARKKKLKRFEYASTFETYKKLETNIANAPLCPDNDNTWELVSAIEMKTSTYDGYCSGVIWYWKREKV